MMFEGTVQALGGLGLFLFGMAVMTGGLRSLADEKLRSILARTVNSPIKGAITGAISTAVLQSSSATTVAAVGFVGAGLLTFSESLGVIFGANIGTTITGWLVALVGFKLNLGQMMLPLIFVGALMRLTGQKRFEQIGMTIAGFGLIFVGIGVLQKGLGGLQGHVTPDHFPPDTVLGRMLLVLIGFVLTLVTQSSSAGVATALAAVHTNTISLNQAAAMVIGMDVGTTATAVLATVGANVHARRTGFAHAIYNTFTGVGAFLLLTPFMRSIDLMLPDARSTDPELVLVGFHTFFNALGVLVVLPFTRNFSNLLIRLISDRGNPLTTQLDRSLLETPQVALSAVAQTLWDVTTALLSELRGRISASASSANLTLLDQVIDALEETSQYLQKLSRNLGEDSLVPKYVALLHVLDHLRRIEARLREDRRLKRCRDDSHLTEMSEKLLVGIECLCGQTFPLSKETAERIHAINDELKTLMKKYRLEIVNEISAGTISTTQSLFRMDTARTLRRIGHHLWRIAHHLSGGE
ncbi:MAG: hypothetical protein Tsb009_19730 [Planctomycetaceae bacterium]